MNIVQNSINRQCNPILFVGILVNTDAFRPLSNVCKMEPVSSNSLRPSVVLVRTEGDAILFDEGKDDGEEKVEEEEAAISVSLKDFDRRDLNLLFCLPTFSYICVYQVFIYFVVQLETFYKINPAYTGLLMAAFHAVRMIVIAANVPAPKTSHLIGSLVGTAGFAILVMYPYTPNVYLFSASTIATGFAESIAGKFSLDKLVSIWIVSCRSYIYWHL